MIGYVHSVETLGTVDNGGIRFVLFMQGCAMRCAFCHNPDTWLKAGRPVTVEEVLRWLLDYKDFFDRSGGGLTVSGGEPLLQWRFVKELFRACGEEGVHRALDTAGYCRHGNFREVLGHTDLLLFSVKVINPARHRSLTGVDNSLILENLGLAVRAGIELVVRYVLIPGVNDSPGDLAELAALLRSLGNPPLELLPYHRLGTAKWEQLGLHYALPGVPEATHDDLARARETLVRQGVVLRRERR